MNHREGVPLAHVPGTDMWVYRFITSRENDSQVGQSPEHFLELFLLWVDKHLMWVHCTISCVVMSNGWVYFHMLNTLLMVRWIYVFIKIYNPTLHGGCTSENVEHHMRKNVGWILFKTHNFTFILDIQWHPLKLNLGLIYHVQCALSCGTSFNLEVT